MKALKSLFGNLFVPMIPGSFNKAVAHSIDQMKAIDTAYAKVKAIKGKEFTDNVLNTLTDEAHSGKECNSVYIVRMLNLSVQLHDVSVQLSKMGMTLAEVNENAKAFSKLANKVSKNGMI